MLKHQNIRYNDVMRTTLAIDDDLLEVARKLAKGRSIKFKTVVNQALRAGLLALQQEPAVATYETMPVAMHLREGWNLDNIGEVLDSLDAQDSHDPHDARNKNAHDC